MRQPWFMEVTVPTSGSARSSGAISLVKARTLSITTSVAFPAASTDDAIMYLYYSPDGSHWDSISFTSWAVTHTASTTVQRTVVVNVPEHGFIRAVLTNGSSSKTMSNVMVWYTIQSWQEGTGADKGSILSDSGED